MQKWVTTGVRWRFFMGRKNNDFGFIFWFHLLFIVFTYLAPILFSWWLVFIGVILLQLQYLIFGGCILTQAELGKHQYNSFYFHYLSKIFPKLKPKPVYIFSTYILSALGVLTSLILQLIFHIKPILI